MREDISINETIQELEEAIQRLDRFVQLQNRILELYAQRLIERDSNAPDIQGSVSSDLEKVA